MELQGTSNFRDLGGLPVRGGKEIAPETLFRSDSLANLTPAGEAALQASPIDTVVDLRLPAERARQADRLPAAGKDRTGVSAALILDTVGVNRADIEDDYAVTEQNLAGVWTERMMTRLAVMGVPDSARVRALVSSSPRPAIRGALAWVDDQYGSSAAYLASGGLTDDEIGALHDVLVA